jgi:YHS domain-containing protein
MTTIDPVCNTTVEQDEAQASATFDGRTYYFCSAACRNDFQDDPEAYLHQA